MRSFPPYSAAELLHILQSPRLCHLQKLPCPRRIHRARNACVLPTSLGLDLPRVSSIAPPWGEVLLWRVQRRGKD